mgnify:FL=1
MSYKAIFSSSALKEVKDSYNWYEQRSNGLGDRFFQYVNKSIELIISNPEAFPIKKNKFRETPIDKFPYLIIYEMRKKNSIAYILHVFHTKRNPNLKYIK